MNPFNNINLENLAGGRPYQPNHVTRQLQEIQLNDFLHQANMLVPGQRVGAIVRIPGKQEFIAMITNNPVLGYVINYH